MQNPDEGSPALFKSLPLKIKLLLTAVILISGLAWGVILYYIYSEIM